MENTPEQANGGKRKPKMQKQWTDCLDPFGHMSDDTIIFDHRYTEWVMIITIFSPTQLNSSPSVASYTHDILLSWMKFKRMHQHWEHCTLFIHSIYGTTHFQLYAHVRAMNLLLYMFLVTLASSVFKLASSMSKLASCFRVHDTINSLRANPSQATLVKSQWFASYTRVECSKVLITNLLRAMWVSWFIRINISHDIGTNCK